jgi:glutathione S-transferase
MKLYYSAVLSPHKACAVARYLKSPVEFVYLDLVKGEQQAPAYLVLNPNGKVPTLVDGERVVWEDDAVMCYLAERAGSEGTRRCTPTGTAVCSTCGPCEPKCDWLLETIKARMHPVLAENCRSLGST